MRPLKRPHVHVAAALVALSLTPAAGAQTECGSSVTVGGSKISVASEMGSDTENLQCALDAAVEQGIPKVELTSSEYTIDSVTALGFRGSISGISKANTVLKLAAGGVDCSANDPSALRFYVGSPIIEKMTIEATELCGGTGQSASAIGFYSNANSCTDDRTIFSNVDRVVITGPGSGVTDMITAVSMTKANACDEIVLGTLKVNRSEISGLAHGVVSSIGGAGQVDINFNTFASMGTSIAIANANQGSSIAGNTINYNDTANFANVAGFGSVGIVVGSDANAPTSNLTSIKKNTFKNGDSGTAGYAVLAGQEGSKVAHSMWIASNRFEGVEVTTASGLMGREAGFAAAPTSAIEYAQDWEGEETAALSGWKGYVNTFGPDCSSYLFGYAYNAIGSGLAVIAEGAESKVLNVYNDYDGTAWGDGDVNCLEASVYREYTIVADNVGDYQFTYDVEPPELAGATTAGFIKVLDPSAGYATTALETTPSSAGEQTLTFTVTEEMVGTLLQFGFNTFSLRSENSGMQYDNLVFGAAALSSGGGGGAEPSGGGSGYGVAVIDTDGAIVSGNRFVDGADAWITVDGSTLGSVSGWSVVDNTFAGSTATVDVALGAQTADAVIGAGQNTPAYADAGSNDILDGSEVNADTDALTSAVSAQFALEWGLINGQ